MKKSTLIISFFLGVFLIASCVDSNSTKNVDLNKSINSEMYDTINIESTTENRYVYIKEVIESNSFLYIKVDYVDYLTGKEALEAEWRDEAYFVDGTDTMTNITNGFYISNINPKVRTLKIEKVAQIEYLIDDEGFQKMDQRKKLNSKQLKEYIDLKTLLFIHIENGIVKRIDERFMP